LSSRLRHRPISPLFPYTTLFRSIGLARSPMSNEAFRELARQSVQLNARNEYDEERWQELARRLQFVVLDDDGYVQLKNELKEEEDRKSTRLNSSHVKISYAVFCL